MRFLDEVIITVRSGDGGKGCVSFRREKYKPKGGPDGGDGGDGGNAIMRVNKRLHSLIDLSPQKYFKASSGKPGKGKNQSGGAGPDLILEVPKGTIVEDLDTGEVVADLVLETQEVLLVPGGRGGKGNQHFATSTHRTPRFAQPGLPGEERRLKVSFKSLADIGLVGLPNSGKSTLLSRLTKARPKIDSYPFTTLIPELGIMNLDDGNSVVMADIPGLIKGANMGRGLGHRFLKHIERTKFILHMLDITYRPESHILEDYQILREEMRAHHPELVHKPHMVAINKMDLYDRNARDLERLQGALDREGVTSLPISAKNGEGVEALKIALQKQVEKFD